MELVTVPKPANIRRGYRMAVSFTRHGRTFKRFHSIDFSMLSTPGLWIADVPGDYPSR